ncbi:MAG TPA: PIG-L family deacetylase [Cellulomonas sp.]
MLAVHAHPDDETLTSGALLATWAAAGLPALVVTCTRGERGEVIGADLAHLEGDAPALATHREHEVAAAAAALDVPHHFLDTLPLPTRASTERAPRVAQNGHLPTEAARSAEEGRAEEGAAGVRERYEDSGMAWCGTGQAGSAGDPPPHALVGADRERAAGRLALLLRVRRPDLVVTYEPGGGYGHPDHVRAHELTMRAVTLAADPAWPAVAASGLPADVEVAGLPTGADVARPSAGAAADGPPADAAADGLPAGAAAAGLPADAAAAGLPAGGTRPEPWRTPGVLWAVTDPAALRAGYVALAVAPSVRALLADRSDRRATREGPLVLPDPDGPLPSVAAAGRPVDVAVPVGPVRDRVLAALRAHATQVQAVTALDGSGPVACYALSNLVLAPVLADETYAWAPGHLPARPVWPAGVRAT